MSDDLTEDEHDAIRKILSGDAPCLDMLTHLRAAMRSRYSWRLRTPVHPREYERVTGDQIRAWLTAGGWAESHGEGGWNPSLGNSKLWRSVPRDGRGVSVFDKDSYAGSTRAIGGMAYHFDLREREVLDQLADIQRAIDADKGDPS